MTNLASETVSVLLPFRNAAPTVAEALSSVLAEDDASLEVIAVDDGSTDEGADIAASIAREDSRVRVVRTPPRGLVAALMRATAEARGSLYARMDADDVSIRGRLATQRAYLTAHPKVAVVGTGVETFGDMPVGDGLARYVSWQNALTTPEEHARDIFVESPLCHPSVMMRRDAFEAVGGYRDAPWAEDYDLWLRFHAAGHAIAKLPDVHLRWRQSAGRLTWTDPRYSLDAFRAARAYYLARRVRDESRDIVIWGAGPTGKRLGRALEREGLRAKAYIDIDPRKIGGIARSVSILPPHSITPERNFVIAAVGTAGARYEIRDHLLANAFAEQKDFLCAA